LILQRLRHVLAWWDLPLTTLEVELAPLSLEDTASGDLVGATAEVAPTGEALVAAAPLNRALAVVAGTAVLPASAPPSAEIATVPRQPAALDECPPSGAASTAAAPIGALGVAGEEREPRRPTAERVTPGAGAAAGVSALAVEPAGSREAARRPAGEGSMRPPRRSRIYSADCAVRLPTMVAAGAPLEPERRDVPVLGMAAPAPGAAAEWPAPPLVAAEPARDPLPARRAAPPAQEVPGAPPAATIPDAVDVPPVRRPANVRWVKTASGTSLPLRPASSDD
jgi:hypothetical protein